MWWNTIGKTNRDIYVCVCVCARSFQLFYGPRRFKTTFVSLPDESVTFFTTQPLLLVVTINVTDANEVEKLSHITGVGREVSAPSSQAAESLGTGVSRLSQYRIENGGKHTTRFTLNICANTFCRCGLKLNKETKERRVTSSSQSQYLFEKSDATKLPRRQLSFFPLTKKKNTRAQSVSF